MRELRPGEGEAIKIWKCKIYALFFALKLAYFKWGVPRCSIVDGRSYPARMARFSG